MEEVDLQEFVECLSQSLTEFIVIEKNEWKLTMDQYKSLYRNFHNLKGSLGMVGQVAAADHIHHLEDLFRTLENESSIAKDLFDILFQGVSSLLDHLEHGVPLKSMKMIEKCQPCKKGLKPDVNCKDSTAHLIQIFKKESLPEVFLVESGKGHDTQNFKQLLYDNGISFSAATKFDDAYCLGKDLLKYKLFIIDARGLDTSFILFLRVLNMSQSSACAIVIGDESMRDHHEHNIDNICFSWIGSESKDLQKKVLNAVDRMLLNGNSKVHDKKSAQIDASQKVCG